MAILISIGLTGLLSADLSACLSQPQRKAPDLRSSMSDQLLIEALERTKNRQIFLRQMIEHFELFLKDSQFPLPAKDSDRIRKGILIWKHDLRFMKKEEREFARWLKERRQNPGVETDAKAIARIKELYKQNDALVQRLKAALPLAPPPREKK